MPKLKTHKGASKRFKKNRYGQNNPSSCLCEAYFDLQVAVSQAKTCSRRRGRFDRSGEAAQHASLLDRRSL